MAAPALYGSEFLVNVSTDAGQDSPAVAGLANGNFVAVWESNAAGNNDAFARVYHADGTPLTGEIALNVSTAGNQGRPVVAALTDGRFVVAWRDDASGNFDIKARIFNGDGTPAGDEFRVNDIYISNNQQEPAIAALTGGGFVISWTSSIFGDDDIRARAFNADGSAQGSEFGPIADTANESQSAVTGLSNGNYVIVWTDATSVAGDTSGTHIEASIFSGNGSTAGLPQNVVVYTSGTSGDQTEPSVVGLSDGNFLVSWTTPVGAFDVGGGGFNASGSQFSGHIFANGVAAESQSSLAALPDGQFVVTWTDRAAEGIDSSGMHIGARRFEGVAFVGDDEFVANTRSIGDQHESAVAALGDGRFLVVWTNGGATPGAPDTTPNAVYAQIFDPRTVAVSLVGVGILNNEWVGTGFADAMDGAAGNDLIAAAAGNDSLYGGTGDDTLDGGTGDDTFTGGVDNDTYVVDSTGDVMIEAADAGIDTVLAAVTRTLDANIENLTLTGAAAANGTGNELANVMVGNAAQNSLKGAGGRDKLQGAEGRDTLVGGKGNDKLNGGIGQDILTGGAGKDRFDFDAVSETGKTVSKRDIIKDFLHATDKVDLSTIDANGSAANDGKFKFVASEGAAFTGVRGQLIWDQQNNSGSANDRTIVSGDINGDRKADFSIELTGLKALTAGDFVL
jgi:Ca2+-binding RTX toxin-like protein